MRTIVSAATLGLLALGSGASAQAMPQNSTASTPAPPFPMGPGGRGLDRMDSDHDGRISRAEYAASMDQRFQRIDANGNGFIDKDEREAGIGRRDGRRDAQPND